MAAPALVADVARLGNLAGSADADMAVNGGALRILYLPQPPGINPRTGRPYAATERSSLAIRDAVRAGIPAGRTFSDAIERHHRVERAPASRRAARSATRSSATIASSARASGTR